MKKAKIFNAVKIFEVKKIFKNEKITNQLEGIKRKIGRFFYR